jgi:hypothetical protein
MLVLTADEVAELTGRVRRSAQVKALQFMGIEHRIRPDGSVAVLRSCVEKVLGGGDTNPKPKRRTEPDFSQVK